MKMTVGQMLQLISDNVGRMPETLGRNSVRRRIGQLIHDADVKYLNLEIQIPKPALSDEGKKALGNQTPAPAGRSRRRKAAAAAADAE